MVARQKKQSKILALVVCSIKGGILVFRALGQQVYAMSVINSKHLKTFQRNNIIQFFCTEFVITSLYLWML